MGDIGGPLPRFEGRTVLVTGGSMGIGAALVDAFTAAGANVVVGARHPTDARDDGREGRPLMVRCDVGVEADRRSLLETATTRFGGIDVLVNNAGFARSAPALDESATDVERTIGTNLTASFELSRLVARQMIAQGAGSIVNVASVSAAHVMDRYALASYAASKAGLVALTRELAAQWGRHGVRVNAVAPGWFPTRMNGFLTDPDQATWVSRHTSLGRPGRVEEMTGPVLFLASDAASYITGQLLPVDGGWH